MWSFQDTFKTRKRSFISAFSICLTVPLKERYFLYSGAVCCEFSWGFITFISKVKPKKFLLFTNRQSAVCTQLRLQVLQNMFNGFKVVMIRTPNFGTFNILPFKRFWKTLSFYRISFLRYLQSLKPTSQIPISFNTKLSKTRLLITVDREIMSTWNFTRYLPLQEKNTKVNIMIVDIIIIDGIWF